MRRYVWRSVVAQTYDKELTRGALTNVIGVLAKLLHPLLVVVITRLFGPDVVGLYFLAMVIADMVTTAVASGFSDAITVFASHHADVAAKGAEGDPEADRKLYRILGNGLAVAAVVGLAAAGLLVLAVPEIIARIYPDRPELAAALPILAWSIPLASIAKVAVAATKARMTMKYDAMLFGFALPAALLCCAVAAWLLGAGLTGLMFAQVISQGITALLALLAVAKLFDIRRTLRAIPSLDVDWRVVRFAIPQNANMAANLYLSRIDVLMLAAYGATNFQVAMYTAASLIASNIRQVKMVYAAAFAPIAARHHASGNREAFEEALGRTSRWSISLAAPIILAVLVLRGDLLVLVDPTFVQDSTFMAVLLTTPFLVCAVGLAGNAIIFTGHSTWCLANSLIVGGLNTLLNMWLIPRYGLLGAATGAAGAALVINAAQIGEIYYLERIRMPFRMIAAPVVGFGLAMAAVLVFWDPASYDAGWMRGGFLALLVVGYMGVLLAFRHEEATKLAGAAARLAWWGRSS